MATAFALVSNRNRHLGGALYYTRVEAEVGLANLRKAGVSYDGIVELHYEEPWDADAPAVSQPLAPAGN